MRETHIAPVTVEGKFHIGRIMEVVTADLYTRWQLFTRAANNITVVHDSWNTYGREQPNITIKQKEELITSYKETKDNLQLLPSGDLNVDDGKINLSSTQEFRDDNPNNIQIVNMALRYLKEQDLVITGIIDGQRGLYLDIDKVMATQPIDETIDNIQIFPNQFGERFKKSLNKDNKSSYLGKIPITKERVSGLPVDKNLLEGESYYTDQRFSPKKMPENDSTSKYKICVSPLVILSLLPYIRTEEQSVKREIDFISNGVGSSLRFNLVSILLNKSLQIEQPYKNIFMFGKLDIPQLITDDIVTNLDLARRVRFTIFDQLSTEHKVINESFPQTESAFNAFEQRLSYLKRMTNFDSSDNLSILDSEGEKYLSNLGIITAMNHLEYVKAFKKLQFELAKRSKQISQGVSGNDTVLIKTIELFIPNRS